MQLIYDVDELLRSYRDSAPAPTGRLVSLSGLDAGSDGYNPSQAVRYNGHTYHYVRVEPRSDEFAYWSVPFRQDGDRWEADPDLPMLHMQDPFVTCIGGRLVVGGVSVLAKTEGSVFFETIMLQGDSPAALATFARGPLNMKDVRLVELPDGRIGIFTRPLGQNGGRGRIGYLEVDDLEDVTARRLQAAELLPMQPVESQWWGVNDAHMLKDGTIGVIAHLAKYDGEDRHYYAVSFIFDPRSHSIVHGPTVVADRTRFPSHPPKRGDLTNVVFPAWLDRQNGLLLCGLSDSAVGVLAIEDPFAAYEGMV